MHCSFQTKDKLFIVMDFMAGGELFQKLAVEGTFSERTSAFYLAEMVSGVDHLHGLGILHRDLKPENILLSDDGHIRLTDFGLAKDFGSTKNHGRSLGCGDSGQENEEPRARTICGTQEYMAPEMVANRGYGKAADYWSLGCITYEMITGRPPFSSEQGTEELIRKIARAEIMMPMGSSTAARILLRGMLSRDPRSRLGAATVPSKKIMTTTTTNLKNGFVGGVTGLKQAAFFVDIDWAKLERKELRPPYDCRVEHDHDLTNFYDGFTRMPIPRSICKLTRNSHKHRRVVSNTFRGFSFVQDDFFATGSRRERSGELLFKERGRRQRWVV